MFGPGNLRSTQSQRGRAWVRLLVGVAAALALVLVGALVALSLIDWDRHFATLAAKVKEETGRELRVTGPIEVGVLPMRVVAEGVSFGNAAWGSRPEMIKAKRVEVRAALLPLLTGDIRLRVELVAPDVLLERNAKGEANWTFTQSPRAAPAPRTDDELPVDLDRVRIAGATVVHRDARTGKTRRLLIDEGLVRPKALGGSEITLKSKLDGVPVEIAATTDQPPLQALARGATLGVKLEAKTAGARVGADGRIGLPASGPSIGLDVSADVTDAQPLARIAGVKLPALPPLRLVGHLSAANRAYRAEKLDVTLGRSKATGRLAVDLAGARPKLTGELAASTIDLTELGRGSAKSGGSTNGGSDGGRVFSRAPLPMKGLNALDADVGVRVARLVVTPELLLEEVQGRVALERGRLALAPLAMRVGGGSAKLVGTFDASSGKAAVLDASLTGSGIELGKMMAALGRADDVTGGRTEVAATLRGAGGSMAALAAGLDGHAKVVVRSARVKGGTLDRLGGDVFAQLVNAVNPTRKSEPYTDVQCAVVNVPIREGVVVVDRTIALETPKVGVAMAGTVNLGTERLDLSVRPQAKQGIGVGLGNLASLAKIEGTLAQPAVGVDMKGAASTAAQVGLGVVTSGLSILAKGLFDKATMDAPCETALRNGAAAAAPAAPKADKPSSGGIGGFFERLLK